jgi:hypothetical protein
LDYEKSWEKTQEYLKQDEVVLFEPAIKFKNLFVRVDILKNSGDKIELIDVKTKNFFGKNI